MRHAIGYGVFLPVAVAALIALPAAIRIYPATVGRALGAAAVACGFLAATFVVQLVPCRPEPDHAWHLMPALAVFAAIGGAIGGSWPVRAIIAAALAALAASLLIPRWPSLVSHRTSLRPLLGIGVFALALLDRPAQETGPRVSMLLLALITASASLLLLLGGTGAFAQLSLALAMSLIGATVAANRPGVVSGSIPVVAVLLPGLMLWGGLQTSTAIPTASYVLMAIAPLALALPVKQRRGWVEFTGVLMMLGMAIGMAAAATTLGP